MTKRDEIVHHYVSRTFYKLRALKCPPFHISKPNELKSLERKSEGERGEETGRGKKAKR